MKVLTCSAARRRLQAFYDGELSISEQVNVKAHLDWCDACVAELDEMDAVGCALRVVAPGRRAALTEDESISLKGLVVHRAQAEHSVSWAVRLREMFDDMHMVYAGLGAALATVVCVLILQNMMNFATNERTPGSNQNPLQLSTKTMFPQALDRNFLAIPGDRGKDERPVAVSATVTREGKVINVTLLGSDSEPLLADSEEAQEMKSLVDAISLTRFEPARVLGFRVAVNMVWLMEHTTVTADKYPLFASPIGANATPHRSSLS